MSSSAITLPYDVLANVVAYVDRDALRHLCLVSHELYGHAVRELYRHIQFAFTAKSMHCLGVLRDSPSLGVHVRWLEYRHSTASLTPGDPGPFTSLLASAIRSMTGLRRLDLRGFFPRQELIIKNEDEERHLTELFDAIAGLSQLDNVEFTLRPQLAPLLPRLNPLRRLVFSTQGRRSDAGLEHILRTSTDTLEELYLYHFGIVSWLKKEPRLVFTRVTRLSLNGCGSPGMELPRAFPHAKRVYFFPAPVELPSLITDPANFPELGYLELRVDEDFKRSVTDVQRPVANLAIFDAEISGPPLAPALMNFLGVFRRDALRSLQLPSLRKEEEPTTTLREILGLFPNLKYLSAKLYGVEHPWVAVYQTFWNLRSPSLRGVSLGFDDDHIDMLAQIVELEINDLRESLPDLTFFELRSEALGSRRMAQFRRDKGMRKWRVNVGVDLLPPEDWPFGR
ncbi:hypothetical protein EXIGLDRAFT_735805 [Exidia glandulosa HHB12029]|uniref:F-box domain-containing protein n=1 Tax=Exidia glandulosa HHB12029 TaxID=1314781 RepID=A0A165JQL7_EXIGL|nr:hypothetical protein EXIGLDRAFT_735805 [Exidia glandulosa HHB12029]